MDMDVGIKRHQLCITDLPEDYLHLIFEKLDASLDRESFGLTCHCFLDIQNSSCKRLELGTLFRKKWPSPNVVIDSVKLDSLLKRFKQLEFLSLSGCIDVSDSGLTRLQNCGSNLRSLYLDDLLDVASKGFSAVASGCPLLSVISLSSCGIHDRELKSLSKSCKYLKEVGLACCDYITHSGIRALNHNCRQLRTLNICWCRKISGLGFQGCSSTLACLKADYCVLTSKGVSEILSGGGLEYLSLASVMCLNGFERKAIGLAAIGSGFAANLKVLDLYKCSCVYDGVILSISKGCPLLQEWDLSFCENISASGYGPIGLYCKSLEIIHLNGCHSFHDAALLALGNGCKRLSVIHMQNPTQVTLMGKSHFKTQREDVKIKQSEATTTVPSWAFTRWP